MAAGLKGVVLKTVEPKAVDLKGRGFSRAAQKQYLTGLQPRS
jgi:hypothetical protein